MTKITAYKGFNEDWTCRGFQFEVGKSYEHEGNVRICGAGFHACENPMDVWGYYGPCDVKYAVVSLEGETDKKSEGDSKIASGKITIEAELSAGEFVKKCVDWLIAATKGKNENSGDSARIGSSGDSARIGSSGYYARIGSSGYSAQIGSSGYSAQIGSSGYSAQIGSSGDSARIDVSGQKSVVASAGYNAKVRGPEGTWVSVAEYDDNGNCTGFATGCIGKDGLKPDVWYEAKGGKLVEVSS